MHSHAGARWSVGTSGIMGFHPIFFPKETLFQVFEITMILGAFLGREREMRALQRPFSIQRWALALRA
ncbi:hypothetical protein MHK_008968, partial [Candidatus Magnetomorum sp. HK-1]